MPDRDDQGLRRLASLGDATRRRLYDFVASHDHPVNRDQVAASCGLERATAAYHLDRLVEDGLLAASFARPEGRGGPGAGRPAKHYSRVDDEITVTVPPRDYPLAAEILARAVESDASGTVAKALNTAASDIGSELVDIGPSAGRDLATFLREQGFEPFTDGDVIRLRNCPFHLLAKRHTELVCGMNHALLSAVAAELEPGCAVRLDPAPDRCCVAFDARTEDGDSTDARQR